MGRSRASRLTLPCCRLRLMVWFVVVLVLGTLNGAAHASSHHRHSHAVKKPAPAHAANLPVEVCQLARWSCTAPGAQPACLFGASVDGSCQPPSTNPLACPATEARAGLMLEEEVPGKSLANAGAETSQTPEGAHNDTSSQASAIVEALGDVSPLRLTAMGPRTLLVSRSAVRGGATQRAVELASLHAWFKTLLSAGIEEGFTLRIPHGAYLGGLAERVNALHSPSFTAEDLGTDRVRIETHGAPGCAALDSFLGSVEALAWSARTESPIARLYTLDAPTAASLLNTAPQPASTPAATKPDDTATETATKPGNAKTVDGKPSAKPDTATKDSASAPAATSANAHVTTAATDLVVFPEGAKAGDDARVSELKRMLALLDLPRPEMIINGWVVQISTKDVAQFGQASQVIRETVDGHNDGLQRAILDGWQYVKLEMGKPNFFDADFYDYLTGSVVLNNADYADAGRASLSQTALESRIRLSDTTQQGGSPPEAVCPAGQYCLGYATLFQPLQPKLTNLLLALIAADDPEQLTNCAINYIEHVPEHVSEAKTARCPEAAHNESSQWAEPLAVTLKLRRSDRRIPEERSADEALTRRTAQALSMARDVADPGVRLDQVNNCETADELGILRSQLMNDPAPTAPTLYMECFRRAATLLLHRSRPADARPGELGLVRRAVADFLFQYKLSQQYPHEFTPYDLTQSADAFNSALNPMITAFNRDLTAYQTYLRERLRIAVSERLGKSHDSFLSDGIVSVRVVSGHSASVSTTSQSYLAGGVAPELGSLAGAVLNAANAGAQTTTTSADAATTTVATNGLSLATQSALAALASYQTTKVNIGRSLDLEVTPRSTVGASGAELNVRLTSSDSADPKYWSSGTPSKNDPDLSRVATHDVKTQVRVDSIVLFDLSSFSAVLSKGRPMLPLLPPFVELPYIGTLAGVPLSAAKEYHSSSAIVSAVVVPTAEDLAFGIRFVSDAVVDSDGKDCRWTVSGPDTSGAQHLCQARRAISLTDLGNQPIREFHRRKLECLATEDTSSRVDGDPAAGACGHLKFGDVLHQAP